MSNISSESTLASVEATETTSTTTTRPRWSKQEENEIQQIRNNLKELISTRKQNIDVIGDHKILRFIRGHNHDIEKATEMYSKFLIWRDTNKLTLFVIRYYKKQNTESNNSVFSQKRPV